MRECVLLFTPYVCEYVREVVLWKCIATKCCRHLISCLQEVEWKEGRKEEEEEAAAAAAAEEEGEEEERKKEKRKPVRWMSVRRVSTFCVKLQMSVVVKTAAAVCL